MVFLLSFSVSPPLKLILLIQFQLFSPICFVADITIRFLMSTIWHLFLIILAMERASNPFSSRHLPFFFPYLLNDLSRFLCESVFSSWYPLMGNRLLVGFHLCA
ncbi:hypothetical protein P3S67_014751 [Capsicum chacoense]